MSFFGESPDKKVKRRRNEVALMREVWRVLSCTIEKLLEIAQLSALHYMSPFLLYAYVVTRVLIK